MWDYDPEMLAAWWGGGGPPLEPLSSAQAGRRDLASIRLPAVVLVASAGLAWNWSFVVPVVLLVAAVVLHLVTSRERQASDRP